jgi:hypothetical protein
VGGTYAVNAETGRATVTIADNEPVVSVTASDPQASEAGDPGQFTVARTGDVSSPLRVGLQWSGTARNGLDYDWLPDTVTISAGQASATVPLVPRSDPYSEGAESAVLAVVPGRLYSVDPQHTSAAVSILDQQ